MRCKRCGDIIAGVDLEQFLYVGECSMCDSNGGHSPRTEEIEPAVLRRWTATTPTLDINGDIFDLVSESDDEKKA